MMNNKDGRIAYRLGRRINTELEPVRLSEHQWNDREQNKVPLSLINTQTGGGYEVALQDLLLAH